MPKISAETISEISDRLDIVELINPYIEGGLRKTGVNYTGKSPFREEKTASLSVRPDKKIFKDFGDPDKKGSGISFIMFVEKLDFPSAVIFIAKKLGVEVKYEVANLPKKPVNPEKELCLKANLIAQEYFQEILFGKGDNSASVLSEQYIEGGQDTGEKAGGYLKYLTKERGFTKETIKKFAFGAVPQKNFYVLQKYARKKGGLTPEDLLTAGLVTKNAKGNYTDFFRGRVMTPIFDFSARIIGFAGRYLGDTIEPEFEKAKTVKWLNIGNTAAYKKGWVLYGIHLAKDAIRKLDNVYIVEGYFDVASLHQSGVENVLAISGTSNTIDQAQAIKRLTSNVTLLLDGDAAGIKATVRCVKIYLENGFNVNVLELPDKMDPDDFRKKHGEKALYDFLQTAADDFVTYFIKKKIEKLDHNNANNVRLAITSILAVISSIPDRIYQEVAIKKASRLIGYSEESLFDGLRQIKLEKNSAKAETQGATDSSLLKVAGNESANTTILEIILGIIIGSEEELEIVMKEIAGQPFNEGPASWVIDERRKEPTKALIDIFDSAPSQYKEQLQLVLKSIEGPDLGKLEEGLLSSPLAIVLLQLKLRVIGKIKNLLREQKKAGQISPEEHMKKYHLIQKSEADVRNQVTGLSLKK